MHRLYNTKYVFMIIPTTSIHFCNRLDRPWGSLSLLYNGHRVLSRGYSGRSVALATHLKLAPKLKED